MGIDFYKEENFTRPYVLYYTSYINEHYFKGKVFLNQERATELKEDLEELLEEMDSSGIDSSFYTFENDEVVLKLELIREQVEELLENIDEVIITRECPNCESDNIGKVPLSPDENCYACWECGHHEKCDR